MRIAFQTGTTVWSGSVPYSQASDATSSALPPFSERASLQLSSQPFITFILGKRAPQQARNRHLEVISPSKHYVLGIFLTEVALIGLGGPVVSDLASQSVLAFLSLLSAASSPHSNRVKVVRNRCLPRCRVRDGLGLN